MRTVGLMIVIVAGSLSICSADDWPTYLQNSNRTGATGEQLSLPLQKRPSSHEAALLGCEQVPLPSQTSSVQPLLSSVQAVLTGRLHVSAGTETSTAPGIADDPPVPPVSPPVPRCP